MLLAAACSAGPDLVETVRALPAAQLDETLPAERLDVWIAAVAAPSTPVWRLAPCEAGRCVEARAERSNGIHFGILVVPAGAEGTPRIEALYLEQEGGRRGFDTVDAWAIAVAGLAPAG